MAARSTSLRIQLNAAKGWIGGLDGGLLGVDAWRRRHRVVCAVATVDAVLSVVFAAREPHGSAFWFLIVGLAVALTLAWLPGLGRRPREVAVVVALGLCAALQNRYVGNLSALAAAYILLLAVYQDWLPLAVGLVFALFLPVAALIDPSSVDEWRAFHREDPEAGALFRFLGVSVAAGVAVFIWRANGIATRDGLTGLATGALVERRLRQSLRSGRRPAVLVCDVDAFRLVADDLPRQESDALVAAVGHRLRLLVHAAGGVIAASGGARYVVAMLDSTSETAAALLARELCHAIAGEPFVVQGARVPLTISVGIALGQPDDDAHDLIRAAAIAMRRAKWRGDVPIVVAERLPDDARSAGAEPITAELRRALQRDELVMHYQPLVRLRSGELVGAEALVRWQHPTRGLLSPASFLPVTEMHPWLNAAVGRAIVTAVLAQLAQWDRELPGTLPEGVSVNVAPTRLKDPGLRDELSRMLHDAQIEPSRVVLELTEGALMDMEIDAPAVLADLAALGVGIALDDFGTGHSSLAHLRDFPVHEIKVDQSFVARIVESSSDQAVIRAVLAIAAEFGAKIVVEGVELEEQRRALLTLGGDNLIAQGYLFGRALAADEFTDLLRAGGVPGATRSRLPL